MIDDFMLDPLPEFEFELPEFEFELPEFDFGLLAEAGGDAGRGRGSGGGNITTPDFWRGVQLQILKDTGRAIGPSFAFQYRMYR